MGTEQGQEAAGSPPADPSLQVAPGGANPPATPADPPPQPASTPAASDGTPGASPAPADPPPKDEPAANDQLEDALNLLSKPEDRTDKAEGAQPPPKPDGKAPEAKKDEPKEATQEDAYAGFTPEEKRAIELKPKTKDRIEKLYGRARAAETRLQALELVKGPAVDITDALRSAKADGELGYVAPQQMVSLTIATAALNRVALARKSGAPPAARDVQTAKQYFAAIKSAAEQIGEQLPGDEFTGEVPKDVKDLHEVYGVLSADEAKAIAALRARKAATPPAPKDPAPAPAAREAVNPERIAAEVADQTWIEATLTTLHDDGVEPAKVQAYYDTNLVPRMHQYLAEKIPNVPPEQVMDKLSPKAKHQLVVMAHRAERAASSPPAARKQEPAPNRGRPLTSSGTSPRIPAPSKGDDHVDSAIDYLARK
jgi:hypothetical protein